MRIGSLLPSDILSVKVKELIDRGVKIGLHHVDLSNFYRWYVDSFESKYNSMHKQYDYSLFRFIVDYLITNYSYKNLMEYTDTSYSGNYLFPVQMDIQNISSYIRANEIPFNSDLILEDELDQLYVSGVFEEMSNYLLRLLGMYNIKYNDEEFMTGSNIKTGIGCGYLPVKWVWGTDIITVSVACLTMDDLLSIDSPDGTLEQSIMVCFDQEVVNGTEY